MDLTTEELKELLANPAWMLLLMLMASLANALKQIIVARQAGMEVRCSDYLSHWPETVATIIGNVLGFLILVATDQLNLASALGIGYGVNSLTDLLRKGGRSESITTPSGN